MALTTSHPAEPGTDSLQRGGAGGPARPAERSLLVDVVRGLAIILVALGHTEQGIAHRGMWGTARTGDLLETAIYTFHMPAFFFVTGVFLPMSLRRHGMWKVLRQRTASILYPYFFWSIATALSLIPLKALTIQQPHPLPEFLRLLLTGQISWFLPTLFVVLLVAIACYPLPRLVFAGLAIALFYLLPPSSIFLVYHAVPMVPFLALGMWVSTRVEGIQRVPVAVCAVVAAVLAGFAWWSAFYYWRWSHIGFLLLGISGTLMLLLVARCVGSGSVARALAWCGGASLAIFLLSEFPQGAARQALLWMHVTNPWVQLVVPTLFAVVVPAWLYHRRYALRLGWTFNPPWQDRGAAGKA